MRYTIEEHATYAVVADTPQLALEQFLRDGISTNPDVVSTVDVTERWVYDENGNTVDAGEDDLIRGL